MLSKKAAYNVCVVGVGAVGLTLLRVLRERRFPIATLTVLAQSDRVISIDHKTYEVREITPQAFQGQDIVLFAGTEGEKGAAVTYAKKATEAGAVVIDNGSDFRLDPEVPLVIPEVNPEDLKRHRGLIANPNCSTVQMVMALSPIHRAFGLRRVIVSTYQAASGAGSKASQALLEEAQAILSKKPIPAPSALPQPIAFNVFPHIGLFEELGYTSEEWKMVRETRKILHDDRLPITATAARVPVVDAHCESVYFETARPAHLAQITELWRKSPGLTLLAQPDYPMPIQAANKDEVFVGRLRADPFFPNAFTCWVVSDNLRKGAALNAVQIAEKLIKG